jgi:hypothetical protein
MEGGSVTPGSATVGSDWATRAEAVAVKFDQIYPLETKILGYEFGGGLGGDGGKDLDSSIQILVYDIGTSDVLGFFWAKDFYPEEQGSNEAEIFYISAGHMASKLSLIYTTLVHEFQHMINFNVKNVKKSMRPGPAAWYNEMLSMLAEDMISPLPEIDIAPTNEYHPIAGRITTFLTAYANANIAGINQWDGGTNSYANRYAFGAYLARNYGGAELVKNILENNTIDIPSIVAAARTTTGNTSIDINYILEKYAEAFIFTNSSGSEASFNKTVSKTINGTEYTFTGFNIWANYNLTSPPSSYIPWRGPTIYLPTRNANMDPYSIYVQGKWTTGSVSTITLNKPASSDIKLFLMVR